MVAGLGAILGRLLGSAAGSYAVESVKVELVKTALAAPNGALFGLAYGTAIRIGYEQLYPALFPKKGLNHSPQLNETVEALRNLFTITGGLGAFDFGIEKGLLDAAGTIPQGTSSSSSNPLEQLDAFFKSLSTPQYAYGSSSATPQEQNSEDMRFESYYQSIQNMSLAQLMEQKKLIEDGKFPYSNRLHSIALSAITTSINQKTQGDRSGFIQPTITTPTSYTPPVSTRDASFEENQYNTYMAQVVSMLQEILKTKAAVTQFESYAINIGRLTSGNNDAASQEAANRRAASVNQELKNMVALLEDQKDRYYNFISISRNSQFSSIKTDATNRFRDREV